MIRSAAGRRYEVTGWISIICVLAAVAVPVGAAVAARADDPSCGADCGRWSLPQAASERAFVACRALLPDDATYGYGRPVVGDIGAAQQVANATGYPVDVVVG